MMEWTTTINTDGTVVVEVTKRENTNCDNIKRVTNSVGTEVSDERTGPDCDHVEEIQRG